MVNVGVKNTQMSKKNNNSGQGDPLGDVQEI